MVDDGDRGDMGKFTRRTLLASAGVLATAGCLDWQGAGPSSDRTPTSKPPVASPSLTETETDGGITSGVNEFDPDHPVSVHNRQSESRTVQVTVHRRKTGETVFEKTVSAQPGTDQQLYNLKEANPDGIEQFQICGSLQTDSPASGPAPTVTSGPQNGTDGTTHSTKDCATVRTSACYGSSHVTIRDDGSIGIIYSVC